MLSQHYVSLNLNDVSLKTCLRTINHETGVGFLYSGREINKVKSVSVIVINERLDKILDQILLDNGFSYKIENEVILIQKVPEPIPEPDIIAGNSEKIQEKNIQGIVSDEDGNPLPGVNVIVKGTSIGTITDINGHYSIDVPIDAQTLEFSFVGMQTQEAAIGNSTVIDISMKFALQTLEEVAVTALGIERAVKSLGFSAQKIEQDALSASRESNVTNYLIGKVAGVQVSRSAGGTGSSTNVIIRGNSSISGENQPLYVVDGIPILNYSNSNSRSGVATASVDQGDGIGDINPQDVESMNVLKGPAATALYGSRGANGVIIITTKSGKGGAKGLGIEINSGLMFEEISMIPKFQNKFGTGWDDEGYANYSWGGFTFDDIYYPWPENGQLYSWGGPLDGSQKIPNWWTLPEDGSIPSSVWDCPITEAIPYVAQPEDNVRNFFETGITYSNNVALTSNSDKSSMRLSFGNISIKGVVPNHEIKKNSASFRGSTKVNKVLSFEGKINYIRTEGEQRPSTGYSASNPMYNLIQMGRNTPLDFIKEQYETTKVNIRYPGINYNPYFMVNEIRNNDIKDRVIGFSSVTLTMTDWLSLTGRVGIDFYNKVYETRWPWDPNSKNSASRKGQMTQSIGHTLDLNSDVMLRANKTVWGNINLNGIVGANLRTYKRDNMYWSASEFKAIGVYDISNFVDIRPDYGYSEREMQSVFFIGQADYKKFLYLDITGRNDWSSTLGVEHQSYFYPSVSTSFVFTDVLAINKDILSFGKIRASWAQVGNDTGPYRTREGYNLHTTGFDGLPYASKNGTLPLWDLKNELTESIEFGADLRFLSNRIRLDVTYYNGKTTNQILGLSVSQASGYGSAVVNAGEIQNRGIELTMGITPLHFSGFRWDIDANFAVNRSEVVVLDGNIETYRLISTGSHNAFSDIHAQVGAPYGNIIGYAYKRAPDGQKIVSDAGIYQHEEKTSVLGNITPDWIGGVNNTFSYKGFSLNVLIDFVQGGDVVSATKYEMTRIGTGEWTLEGRRPQPRYLEGDDIPSGSSVGDPMPYTGILEGVVEITDAEGNVTGYEENTQAVPGMRYWANRAWGGISEEFVEDGSYISLREVMFSYRFQPSILNKTPFTGLTISAIGRNLAYLQNKMDYLGLSPESAPNTAGGASGIEALAVPVTRSYGLNIKLLF